MSDFNVSVKTRGVNLGYRWIAKESTVCAPMQADLEGSKFYALCIRKKEQRYHGALHIYMPENRDRLGGLIRLEIAIENLSETQARALSIAYLKLPISGDIRIWKEAQETYAPESDGFCTVDIPKLQKIIDETIKVNEPCLSNRKPEYKLHMQEAHTNKGGMKEKAIEHLRQYSLTSGDGIKIFLNDQIKIDEADLLLQLDNLGAEKDSVQEIKLQPQKPSDPKDPIAEKPKICSRLEKMKAFAEEKYREAISSPVITSPPVKKLRAGCVIFTILLGILILILFDQVSSTARTLITVASAHPCRVMLQGKGYHIRTTREIKLADSETGVLELEVTQVPEGSIVIFNGLEIGKAPGKFQISAQGGTLQILPPESVHPDKSAGTDGSGYFRGKRRFIRTPISRL